MDLKETFTSDHLCWDGVEGPASFEVARRQGNAVDSLPVVKRRQVRGKEQSPSGGVYAGYEVRFLVPASTLTAGLAPKPGDVLIDPAGGTRWTVLRADLGKGRQTWTLGCVDLVLALDLRETVTVERPSVSYDSAGAAVKRWPTGAPPNGGSVAYTLPASVQLVTDEVVEQRGIRGFLGNYAVTVDRQVAVSNEDRVRWADALGVVRYLDVRGYHNATRLDQLPVIDCELRP